MLPPLLAAAVAGHRRMPRRAHKLAISPETASPATTPPNGAHTPETGDRQLPVLGYGDVDIQIRDAFGRSRKLHLTDVLCVPELATNVVSLRVLRGEGYYWDNRPFLPKTLLRKYDGTQVAVLEELHAQYVLEYVPETADPAALFVRRNKLNSWTKRGPRKGSAWRWHLRLGHPGKDALEHLVNSSEGVRLTGIATMECDACGQAKITRQIRRMPRSLARFNPGEKLAIDFHDFEKDKKGYKSVMIIVCRVTGYMWDYYFKGDRTSEMIIAALDYHVKLLERQYGIKVKSIECDGEVASGDKDKKIATFFNAKSILFEPSPANTQALNGAAERSGGVVKTKVLAMNLSAPFPKQLWREQVIAAVYLLNRTPRQNLDWKTPYELLSHISGGEHRKPDQAHLRVYGCKAYAMTARYQKREDKLQKFEPRAWIGYLVGYQSSNTYRIWVPALNRVIHTRDVIFDEDTVFDGTLEHLKEDIKEVDLDHLAQTLRECALPEPPPIPQENLPSEDNPIVVAGFDSLDGDTEAEETPDHGLDAEGGAVPEEPRVTTGAAELPAFGPEAFGSLPPDGGTEAEKLYTTARFEPIPTPAPSPPAALLVAAFIGSGSMATTSPVASHTDPRVTTAADELGASNSGDWGHDHGGRGLAVDEHERPPWEPEPNLRCADAWKGSFHAGTKAQIVATRGGKPSIAGTQKLRLMPREAESHQSQAHKSPDSCHARRKAINRMRKSRENLPEERETPLL